MQGFDQERLSAWGESRKYFSLSFPKRQGRGRAAPTRPLFHYNSRPDLVGRGLGEDLAVVRDGAGTGGAAAA